jgi:hypothetical protein
MSTIAFPREYKLLMLARVLGGSGPSFRNTALHQLHIQLFRLFLTSLISLYRPIIALLHTVFSCSHQTITFIFDCQLHCFAPIFHMYHGPLYYLLPGPLVASSLQAVALLLISHVKELLTSYPGPVLSS